MGTFESLYILGVRIPTFNGRRRLRLIDGVTALVGPNGSGKSVALSGIKIALTGEDANDERSKILDEIRSSQFLRQGQKELLETFRSLPTEVQVESENVEARLQSATSVKVGGDDFGFRGANSPLVYFSLPEDEDEDEGGGFLPFDRVDPQSWANSEFRTVPRNIDWQQLEGGGLAFGKFIARRIRTLRHTPVMSTLGFCVPPQLEELSVQWDVLRSYNSSFKSLPIPGLQGQFFLWLTQSGPEDGPLLELEDGSYSHPINEAVDEVLATIGELQELDICVLAGTKQAFSTSELPEYLAGEIPDWAPLVGFEIEPDPMALDQEKDELGVAVEEELSVLENSLAKFDVYDCAFSPEWEKLYEEVQSMISSTATAAQETLIEHNEYGITYGSEWEWAAQQFADQVIEVFSELFLSNEELAPQQKFEPLYSYGWSMEIYLPGATDPSETIPISAASDTTQRWAALAVQLATWLYKMEYAPPFQDHPPVVLIDEPERGLGAQAQQHLARGLRNLHEKYDFNFILATHSAQMISEPDTRIVRLPDFVEIPEPTKLELDELGFSSSELFAFYRSIILVEGHHEEIILRELIGPELSEKRARILPYRGTSKLSSAALDDLFDFSGSQFVVTADNTRTDIFNEALDRLRRTALEDDTRIDGLFDDLTQEEQAIKSLLLKAHRTQKLDRIKSIVGLDAADILDCLPVQTFTQAGTWEELREAHENDRATGVKDTPNDFKKWLEKKHNVDLSDENILLGVQQLDELPDFIAQLLDAVS